MGSVRNAKTPNVRIVEARRCKHCNSTPVTCRKWLRFIIAGFVAVRGEAEGDRLVGAVCLIVEGVLAI
jgi:hypothetical protein